MEVVGFLVDFSLFFGVANLQTRNLQKCLLQDFLGMRFLRTGMSCWYLVNGL